MKLRKTFRALFLSALVVLGILGGWPNSFFQNKVASAAAPTFSSFGAIAASTGPDVTVTLPTHATNNIMLLLGWVRDVDDTVSITTATGWTQLATWDRGATSRYWLFWKRAASASETNPVFNKSGATGDTYAAAIVYSGANTSGDPWEVVGSASTGTTDPSTITGISTLSHESLVVVPAGGEDNNNASITTTGTNPAAYAEHYVESNTGGDGTITFSEAERITLGAIGNVSVDWNVAAPVGWGGRVLALKPVPVTTIGNGTNPSNSSIAPGASATDLDSFTLQTNTVTDTVTAATVTLAAGTSGGLSAVAITSDNGSTTYCSQSNPVSDSVALTSCGIPVTTTSTQFKIRVTPKSHANMPAPPGSTYSVTGTVTAFTSTNGQAGTDTNSATVTIDNASPANVTAASGTAGSEQVSLSWTNPADSDFNSSVVLRSTSAVTDSPVEGTTYIVGNTIGFATVACVVASPTASCTDTGLINGTAYHYKIFSRDNYANYATGVVPTGSPFTPVYPTPTTTSISPTSKTVGDSQFTMTVNGTNFVGASVVRLDGSNRTTTFVNSTQLTATIPASDMLLAGTFSITVFNPTPGGGTSNAQTFTVNNPAPTTTSISPDTKTAGDAGFTLTVNGTNFVSTSVVRFNGSNRSTTFINSTQLTASILTSDIATNGTFSITVFNSTPGGGTSNAQTLTVNNPSPTTTSISPTFKTVGDTGFTLTVNGTNFASNSVVRFNGSDRVTTFVNSTQVTAAILTSDLTTATSSALIRVFNPAPGGGLSNAQTFVVYNPTPTTTSIDPTFKTAGDNGFTLTVNGTNFISGATVKFAGSSRTTSFVNSTQLTASILTSDLTTAGTFDITVANPSPVQADSNAQTFTVNNGTPTTTSISPTFKTVGDTGFTLTVNGTNFASNSVVRFNGSDRVTTFVNSTQVTAAILTSDLTTATSSALIRVFNPAPGGGLSNAQTFVVYNPTPTTTSIDPTFKTAGDSGFTLTVNGTNFISGATVKFAGSSRTTSFVNSTQLTASILTSDLTTAGTFDITVANPSPVQADSNAQTFTVNNGTPTTTSISPTFKTVGDTGFTLTVNGTNFASNSVVRFNGSDRVTTFVNSTQVTAAILTSDLTTATSSALIRVFNPAPGGGLSNAQTFTVNAVANPAPTTTSISPTSATVGDTGFTMTVNGTNFIASSTVQFNGSDRVTTFASSTQVTAAILTSDLTTAGTFNVTVVNLAPGGGTSNAQTFTVNPGADATPPVVTAFDIPSTSTSLTVAISTFTATDGTGVTGYKLTESAPAPSAASSGWTVSAPSSYAFATQGSKTLYAWAKDAAGNVSTSLSASTTITFVEIAPSQLQGLFTSNVITPSGASTSTTQITFNQEVHINYTDGSRLTIPFNAVMNTATSADFTQLAASNAVSTGDLPANYTSVGVVQYGLPSTTLTSSQAITISIFVGASRNGQTLTVFKKPAGGSSWSQLTTCLVSSGRCELTTTGLSAFCSALFTSPSLSATTTGAVKPTTVNFSGQAFPGAKISVIDRDVKIDTPLRQDAVTSSGGKFNISFEGILQSQHTFGLLIKDKDNRITQSKFFRVDTTTGELTEKDLLVPPTVGFVKSSVRRGENLAVVGYAAPGYLVSVEINGKMVKEVTAGTDGSYKAEINTGDIEFGSHTLKAKQINKTQKTESDYSASKVFIVSRLPLVAADFNGDGKIDIKDWSIFLSKWSSTDPTDQKEIDINGDGKVDVSDFSIFIRNIKR